MRKVKVIAAMGAKVTGPCKLKITKDQHAIRSRVLGPWKKNGTFELDGGEELQFKFGEVLNIDRAGRLNVLLFEDITPERKAKPKKAPAAKPPVDPASKGAQTKMAGDAK